MMVYTRKSHILPLLLAVSVIGFLPGCTEKKSKTILIENKAGVSGESTTVTLSETGNVVANGVDATMITVIVRDALWNPVADQIVEISASGSNNIITQPAEPTENDGVAAGILVSTSAELKTITVTINPGPDAIVVSQTPTVEFIGDPSTIDAGNSLAAAIPDTGVVANGAETSTVYVTVRDVYNNPVSGQVVNLAATGSGNTVTQPSAPTDADGMAFGTVASTTAEVKLVTATVNPGPNEVVLTLVPTVEFVGDPATIDADNSTATANPTTGLLANGTDVSLITVTVRDTNNNPVSGQTVQLAASGSNNTITQPAGPTDASGVATGTIASITAEVKTVTVTVNPGPGQVVLTQMPLVEFLADAGNVSAINSSATANPSTGVLANGSDVSTITATVRDGNNNPVSGQTVQLSATGSNNTVTQPAGPTNASGVATGTIASTTAEIKTVTITVNPGPSEVVLTQTPTVAFVGDSGSISAGNSGVSASPSTGVVANGVQFSTITVTVRDTNNNPVGGQMVLLLASGSNNTVTQPAGPTNASGVAAGTVASLKAETKTITAIVNPGPSQIVITQTPTVAFVGDPSTINAGNSTASASPSTGVVADGVDVSTITVTVRDANTNPVSGQTVQLSATGSDNTITQPAGPTNASGVATGTIASTTAEIKTITIAVNPGPSQVILTQTPTVEFVADPSTIDADNSTASASPSSGVIADGIEMSTITVTVRDANNNPVSGQTVQLSATGSNNTLFQPAGPTNASGVATGTITSITAEVKTVTITVNPGPSQVVLTQTPTVEFVGDPSTIDAGNSGAVSSPSTGVLADGVEESTITVTVRDANNNPVSGQTVQLASTGSNNTVTQPAGPTNASGVATGTIASTTAEVKTVTVSVNPGPSEVVLTQTPTVEFVGDPATIDADNSTGTASPSTGVVADGLEISTITVTVRDANNNPVAGQTVQLFATGSNNTVTQPAGPTNASGVALGSIASTTAEIKTITIAVNPGPSQVILTQTPTVDFVGDSATIDADNSTASASPSTGVIADGIETSTITVTVRDANNNPVSGQTVQLSATGSNNTLFQPAGPTNASGVATGTITSITAEVKTITVTVNPGPSQVVLTQTPTVEFVGDLSTIDAGNSSAASSPSTGVVADGVEVSTITVTVRDANSNPVMGQTVQLFATGSNNTITQPAGPTNASGVATGTIASTTAEIKTVTIAVNPGPSQVVLTDTPTVEFVGDPSTIDGGNSSAVASPSTGVIADGVEVSTVTVTVRDVNSNPVAGQTVQLSATGSSNTITQPAGPTNASGVATGTIASTTAEVKTITVTVNPGPSEVVLTDTPTVEFLGDPSTIDTDNSTATASPSTGVIADGVEVSTITVTVRDANSNPVAGQIVQLSSTGSNNTLTQPPALTNGSGVAAGTIASTLAEVKTITVTVNPGPSQVVLTQTPTAEFVGDPSTIDADNSSVSASPGTGLIADGVDLSTVTVTVRDANSNPVMGQTVQLFATGSNNLLNQPAGPTNASGVAAGTIASTTAEIKTVTITVNPGPSQVILTPTPTVEFLGDPSTLDAANSSATASPSAGVVADGVEVSTVTVTVRDANNNPVSGQTVQLSATGSNNTVTQPASPTNASGVATGTIATTLAEVKTITVTVNPGPSQVVLTDTPTVEFVGDPATIDAGNSSAVSSPGTGVVADGVEVSTITVTVRDANSNPVSGQTVQLSATGSNNTVTQPAGPTNASGVATGTIASTTAEVKTITVTVNPGPSEVVLTDTPTVEFIADASTIDAGNSSASANPSTGVTADGVEVSTITVTVRDANSNPVSGQTVQLLSTGSNNTVTQPAGPTNASGVATGTIASTTAEIKTLMITVNPGPSQVVLTDTPTVEFVADAGNISPGISSASASPSTGVVADGVEVSTITVTVRDVNNNPVSGQTVQLSPTGSNNTVTQPAGPTNASGVATGTIASTTAEVKTITVTVNPGPSEVVLTDAPTVEFIGDSSTIDAGNSSASASPSTGVVADGVEVSTITVTVLDVNSNPVPGQTVQLSSTGSNNTVTQPAGPTNASGVATGTIASTTAEVKTITVTVNPGPSEVVLTDTPTVEFVGDPSTIDAGNSSATASPSTGVVADGVEVSTITVTVRDANSNPVPGQTVQLASTGSNNTVTQPAGPTNASGVATGTIASTTAEVKTITVTVNPGPSQVILTDAPTVEFVGDPSTISAANSSVSPSPASGVNADGSELSTITVTVRDANNNPVSGQTVQLSATGTGNTLTQPPGATDASGEAAGTLASTKAEEKTVTATVNPGPSQIVISQTPTIEFVWPIANTYFVRVTGYDPVGPTGGTSPATAWRTLNKAAGIVGPGDTVYVGAGVYVEQVILFTSGTSGNEIRFIADSTGAYTGDAGDVVIDGNGVNETVFINGADYNVLEGFIVRGASSGSAPSGGIRVSGADNVIRSNILYGNPHGIYVHDGDDNTVESNRVCNNDNTVGDGIVIDNSDNSVVKNNLIYNNAARGILVSGSSLNLLIESNTLYMNGGDQIYIDASGNNVTIRNNIVTEGLQDGIERGIGSLASSTYNDVWWNALLNWNGLAAGIGDISQDPLFIDPDGPDTVMGGTGWADDSFHLDTTIPSPAEDAGSTNAVNITLSDGTDLSLRTTRNDGVLDGTAPDGATVNMGFHYEASTGALADLAQDDSRLFYGEGNTLQVKVRTWDDSAGTWSAETAALPGAGTIKWTVNKNSPLASSEELLAVLYETGAGTELTLYRWLGSAWSEEWSATAIAGTHVDKRGFAVEYEASSGDALVVYSDNTDTPAYRTWSAGAWSSEQSLPLNDGGGPNPDTNSGIVLWAEMESRPGSDEIALAFVDDNDDLVAIIWDGTQWITASATTLETGVKANPVSGLVHNRAFDVAYEASTGDLMVAWARGSTSGFWYSTKAAGSNVFSAAAQISALASGVPHFVDLAGEPNGDRIAGGFFDMGDGTERLGLATWDGGAWVNAGEYDSQTLDVNNTATGDFHGGVGWVGVTGVAVCVYPDNQTGTIDWARWTAGGGWAVQTDIIVAGKNYTESVATASYLFQDKLFVLFSDQNSDLFAFLYDGTSWTFTNGGTVLETDVSSLDSVPFSLELEGQ